MTITVITNDRVPLNIQSKGTINKQKEYGKKHRKRQKLSYLCR